MNISSTETLKNLDILNASFSDGSYLSFSIAKIVCLDTCSCLANSS